MGLKVRWLGDKPRSRVQWLGDATQWFDSGCSSGPRVRYNDGGQIEIEGGGIPMGTLAPGVNQWSDLIWKYANQFQLWAHVVAGVMSLESRGDQHAKSPSNAFGLMQLIPSTASSMAGRAVTGQELLDNPDLNVQLGCTYLDKLTTSYGGNPIKVTAAYNAGGARCGCPCKTRATPGDRTSLCVECLCNPNQWNVVTDCGATAAVDYPMIVFKLANDAWNGAFNPSKNPMNLPGQTDQAKICAGLGGQWDTRTNQCIMPGVSAADTCLNQGGIWDDTSKICTLPVRPPSNGGSSSGGGGLIIAGLLALGAFAALTSTARPSARAA